MAGPLELHVVSCPDPEFAGHQQWCPAFVYSSIT